VRWLGLLGVLAACEPRPTPGEVFTLAHVRDVLLVQGDVVTDGEGAVTFQHATGGRAYGVTVTRSEAPLALRLQTTGLFALREAAADGAVVRLLALVATVNAELWGVSVALDGATGEVSVRVELPLRADMDDTPVVAARQLLLTTADALLPRLQAAVGAR